MGDKGLRVSYGKYVYEHVSGWGSLPDGWEWNHAVGVAVDGQDRIFVYNRSAHPIIVLDTDGNVINHWGEGLFGSAHHIEAGPDGSLYTTDIGDHTVRKWTAEGELLMMLGTPNDPPEMFSGEPFNRPTDIAIAGDGSLYISDGYGNARIHHFTATGELIKSWGGAGRGSGAVPHSARHLHQLRGPYLCGGQGEQSHTGIHAGRTVPERMGRCSQAGPHRAGA